MEPPTTIRAAFKDVQISLALSVILVVQVIFLFVLGIFVKGKKPRETIAQGIAWCSVLCILAVIAGGSGILGNALA